MENIILLSTVAISFVAMLIATPFIVMNAVAQQLKGQQ